MEGAPVPAGQVAGRAAVADHARRKTITGAGGVAVVDVLAAHNRLHGNTNEKARIERFGPFYVA